MSTASLRKDEDGDLSLMEKLRAHYYRKRPNRSPFWGRALFVYQSISQLYVAIKYMMPNNYADSAPETLYYVDVVVCFLFYNMVANWFCLILHKPFIVKTADRPNTEQRLSECARLEDGSTSKNEGMGDVEPLSWKRCLQCQVDMPPRAHHCVACNRCVLKRDHHCYITGVCVGFHNQRYFIVLCFYATVISLWTISESFYYINNGPYKELLATSDYFLPVAIWKTLFGSIPLHILVIIGHFYVLSFIFPVSVIYFVMETCLVATNKTPHEFIKRIPIRSTNTIWRNFRSVFGEFCLVNFIFPAQILFRQADDGYNWEGLKKVQTGRNSNYLPNGLNIL